MTTTIAVAGFHHETNTFSPEKTPYSAFVVDDGWPGLVTGDDVISSLEPLNLGMGGFIKATAAEDVELIPIAWCNAEPYGHVTRDAYDRISSLIVDGIAQCKQLDAIYLDLHGAMVPEHTEDGEGELLRLLREKVGDDVAIVVSLDLHANVTPQMAELSDGITIFRTYPHIDMAETGARAWHLLQQILASPTRACKAYLQVPFLLPLTSQHTGSSPCAELYAQLPELQKNLFSIDFACGFPPADIHHCGASIVAYGSDQQQTEQTAQQFLDQVIAARDVFEAKLSSADEAVQIAMSKGRPGAPVVIADAQDNPGAGGSGDTTGLLEALVRNQAKNAVLGCLWDAEAAALAHKAGIGATLKLALGGRNGPAGVKPYTAEFTVEQLADGRVMCNGPMMIGTELKLGPMALLSVKSGSGSGDNNSAEDSGVRVAVASVRAQCLDQAMLRILGVEPVEECIVAVKSSVHFRNDFEPIASEVIVASCPGANVCDPAEIPYQHLRAELRDTLNAG